MDFLFIFKDEKIAILRCENNEFIPIRYEGEEFFDFKDNFWEWFKEKIEYQNEPLSFVVLNKKEFYISEDIKIKETNEKFCFSKISYRIENDTILTFPKVELDLEKIEKRIKSLKKDIPLSKKTIAEIYKEKTKRYENG